MLKTESIMQTIESFASRALVTDCIEAMARKNSTYNITVYCSGGYVCFKLTVKGERGSIIGRGKTLVDAFNDFKRIMKEHSNGTKAN